MDQQLIDLYHRFVGRAFDRQLRLSEFVEKKAPGVEWVFDTETAILKFGTRLQFEAPIVGSHALHNDSWMWSWANRTIKLSITNRALGDTIRAFAHKAMVPELAKSAFPIEQVIGAELADFACHVFGTVLVGELDYDAYFLMPYEGYEGLLLIRDDRLRSPEKHPMARVLSLFPQLIDTMPVLDHRAAFASYAHSYGLVVVEESGVVKVTGHEKGELTAIFDDQGLLASLKGTGVAVPKPKVAATKRMPIKKVKMKPKPKPKPAANKKAPPKKKPAKKR